MALEVLSQPDDTELPPEPGPTAEDAIEPLVTNARFENWPAVDERLGAMEVTPSVTDAALDLAGSRDPKMRGLAMRILLQSPITLSPNSMSNLAAQAAIEPDLAIRAQRNFVLFLQGSRAPEVIDEILKAMDDEDIGTAAAAAELYEQFVAEGSIEEANEDTQPEAEHGRPDSTDRLWPMEEHGQTGMH